MLAKTGSIRPVPPEPDRLMADVDPALGQQILDVAQRQWVSHVHHHDQTDDLWRAVEISERIAHAPRLTQPGQPRICPDTTFSAAIEVAVALARLRAVQERAAPGGSPVRSDACDNHQRTVWQRSL